LFEPKRILVPTDFSNYSNHALKQAVDIAGMYHSKIYMLHVIDEALQQCMVDYCLPEVMMRQIETDSMKAAREKLQDQVNQMKDAAPDSEIYLEVKRGIPYDEIMKEQEAKDIDLIVIASHGKTGILKTLIGGVVEKVLRGTKCSVLLLRM
jgi:universal stress protein A